MSKKQKKKDKKLSVRRRKVSRRVENAKLFLEILGSSADLLFPKKEEKEFFDDGPQDSDNI